ncbi:MAG: helix-turn-helix domain-containing protein [Bacteroidota bacterium]
MLHYEEVVPPLPLREYIECYWTLISDFSLNEELSLPNGSASLVFNFGPDYYRASSQTPDERKKFGRCTLPHQGKSSVLISQESPIRILGVRFKPYGMAPLFNISMANYTPPFIIHGKELTPFVKFIDKSFWQKENFKARISILNDAFGQYLPTSSMPDGLVKKAVYIMIKNNGKIKITDLHEKLCVSKSTLEKKFQEHVGLSPKILCNILRFNCIVYNGQQDPAPSLTELSYRQGFFDQAHLVHNFRSFTGLPPGRFFKQKNRLVKMLQQSYENRTLKIY